MALKEQAILENFQTLSDMVTKAGHYDVQIENPASEIQPSKADTNQRNPKSLFELLFGVSTSLVEKR